MSEKPETGNVDETEIFAEMETLFEDLRYGARVLVKNRSFTMIAVLTLALGVGANSAIFSVVNALVLKPLPFHNLDRLVAVRSSLPNQGLKATGVSPADFNDWHNQNGVFHLSDLEGALSANTGDGDINVRNARGELSLHTGDGRVDVTGIDGSLRAETGDGRVRASGRFDVLDLRTGDGGIDASAVLGSRLEADWRLSTGDGDLTLHLPDTLAANVELHTNDGHIDLNLPVTVLGRSGEREIRGSLNGGGKLLSLKTGDGSIRLQRF